MTETVPERNDTKALADHCRVYAAGLRGQNELAVGPNMAALALEEAATALEAAQARIVELEARPTIKTHDGTVAVIISDVEIAATARREALEEAAKAVMARAFDDGMVDEYAEDIAAAIRALMEKPNG